MHSFAKHLAELDRMVKRMVFESFGLGTEKYEELVRSMEYAVRGYKYRAPEIEKGESNMGVPPHSDPAFITILNQKVDGLEVQLKNGEWTPVGASPSLYLVMGGHALMVRLASTHLHLIYYLYDIDACI